MKKLLGKKFPSDDGERRVESSSNDSRRLKGNIILIALPNINTTDSKPYFTLMISTNKVYYVNMRIVSKGVQLSII